MKYFDKFVQTVLQCDASSKGLGVILLQNGQPVAFAGRPLTKTECKYAQIEKELLSIVFTAKRFDQYTYGRTVTVQTNHRLLKIIVRKPLQAAPRRLQRMLLRLQRYQMIIAYKPGKELVLADTLSRAHLEKTGGGFVRMVKFLYYRSPFEVEMKNVNAVDCPFISNSKI